MGEYEDRYPEAYGRGEPPAQPASQQPAPQQSVPQERQSPAAAEPPRQARDRPLFRGRLGLGAAAETAPAWPHQPNERPRIIEPTAPPRAAGDYRGLGPRGYVRSPQRIYEDICDRLTDDPLVDASDITVSVGGGEVILSGSVDSQMALRQAETIAQEVAGVARVRNELRLRPGDGGGGPSPGDEVNRAMGAGRGR